MITDEQKRFLRGLEKLTRETGVTITSCGCCNGIHLEAADVSDERSGYCADDMGEMVKWIDPAEEWDWQEHRYEIVK